MKLTGSEKQVKWAEEIRSNYQAWFALAMAELDEDISDEDNDPETISELQAQREELSAFFAKCLSDQTSAAWWIDHRTADPSVVAGSVYKPNYLAAIQRLYRLTARKF